MVAVGLSPRTESEHTIQRRVATAELTTGTEVFNRRDATRDNVVWSLRPWTEVHGYLHGLAPRGPAGSLSGFGGAETHAGPEGVWSGKDSSGKDSGDVVAHVSVWNNRQRRRQRLRQR